MAGFAIKIDFHEFEKEIKKKIRDQEILRIRALKRSGMYMLGKIDETFRREGARGRIKWKSLSERTLAMRRNLPARILQDTGRLRASFTTKIKQDHILIGTNLEYAKLHQEGGIIPAHDVTIKAHTRKIKAAFGRPVKPKKIQVKSFTRKEKEHKIPARPMVYFLRSDKDRILQIFKEIFA